MLAKDFVSGVEYDLERLQVERVQTSAEREDAQCQDLKVARPGQP